MTILRLCLFPLHVGLTEAKNESSKNLIAVYLEEDLNKKVFHIGRAPSEGVL